MTDQTAALTAICLLLLVVVALFAWVVIQASKQREQADKIHSELVHVRANQRRLQELNSEHEANAVEIGSALQYARDTITDLEATLLTHWGRNADLGRKRALAEINDYRQTINYKTGTIKQTDPETIPVFSAAECCPQ